MSSLPWRSNIRVVKGRHRWELNRVNLRRVKRLVSAGPDLDAAVREKGGVPNHHSRELFESAVRKFQMAPLIVRRTLGTFVVQGISFGPKSLGWLVCAAYAFYA